MALVAVLTVIVEVPAPVIEVGLKEIVIPLPAPEADRLMAELKPPVTAVVIVEVLELPRVMARVVGDALTEKPAVTAVTVRVNVVVLAVPLAGVPVTVMV